METIAESCLLSSFRAKKIPIILLGIEIEWYFKKRFFFMSIMQYSLVRLWSTERAESSIYKPPNITKCYTFPMNSITKWFGRLNSWKERRTGVKPIPAPDKPEPFSPPATYTLMASKTMVLLLSLNYFYFCN